MSFDTRPRRKCYNTPGIKKIATLGGEGRTHILHTVMIPLSTDPQGRAFPPINVSSAGQSPFPSLKKQGTWNFTSPGPRHPLPVEAKRYLLALSSSFRNRRGDCIHVQVSVVC